ncbi:hypothetical protein XNC1_0129 [Xenorhabdus nematophila ATCC 19061]|uniref:Uncharacterized protein n=1 Tax=Xenorhabdus nematophila (strain ATCC 19061 / DSM 3370 / CCUG 14189 / LMG 1036 / NCIMB 9965 / AN6) TaxID=406817 RepID=D3VGC7_XENNA|nr:hypothetical protein XNC1_0129 [Xenorhabdus nematophila ATCC 19061]CEK21135.1 hypothetical protein XNC2_0131 [Xenorhabdus nematophila AN6/1]
MLVSRPTQSPRQAPCILKFDYHKNDLAQCMQLASPEGFKPVEELLTHTLSHSSETRTVVRHP